MYLLDTHTFLWYVSANPNLPQEISETISKADQVYLSIISLWEIAIKQSLNKMTYKDSIIKLGEVCRILNINILALDLFAVERIKTLPFIHRDPFDRMLVAQAQEKKLTIITKDGIIPQYDVSTLTFE